MSFNIPIDKQRELDIIQFWLSRTTEPFTDWDFDGENLVILLNNKKNEIYSREDIKTFIKGFK